MPSPVVYCAPERIRFSIKRRDDGSPDRVTGDGETADPFREGIDMFGRIGPMELILILVIALVIFGPKKLPEIGKAIGNAIREFKKHSSKVTEELEEAVQGSNDEPKIESAKKSGVPGTGTEKKKV